MAGFRGVRPKGAGIEIRYQADGQRVSLYLDSTPTPTNLANAARYRRTLIERSRLNEPETRPASFEECCRGFLLEKRKSLKPSTLDGYRSKLEVYWSDLGARQISTIRLTDIKQIDRAIDWNSQKTRRDAHAVLRGVFRWALQEELCQDNPALHLSVGSWQRPEIDAFSTAERHALLNELQGVARVFYGLMFETGARTGELMALQWADVGRESIRIAGSTYRGTVGTTKTHQAREVLLTAEAQRLLLNHTESRFRGETVFLNQYGKPFCTDRGLTWAFRAACRRAGVRYRRPYYCRHTFAARALMAGCEPSWIAQQMGDRLETVMRHYAKWINGDRDRREIAKLNDRNGEEVGNGTGITNESIIKSIG